MVKIVVVGSLNMDLVVSVARLPRVGETIRGSGFQMVPGGKGANQAVAMAKLGAEVAMVGRVGDDAFGETLVGNLARQGVRVEHVYPDGDSLTGMAMIAVDSEGQNSIIITPGANSRLQRADIDTCAPLFARAKILVMQFEIPMSVVEYALEKGREHNLTVILNAAPASLLPEAQKAIALTDFLVVNESEAEILAGLGVHDVATAQEAGEALLPLGPQAVVVTLGEEGAVLVTREGRAHVAAPRVDVVDTTAAGDAFVGGLAISILRGKPLLEAVRYATHTGSLAVTKMGAQPSLPTRQEVAAFLERDEW